MAAAAADTPSPDGAAPSPPGVWGTVVAATEALSLALRTRRLAAPVSVSGGGIEVLEHRPVQVADRVRALTCQGGHDPVEPLAGVLGGTLNRREVITHRRHNQAARPTAQFCRRGKTRTRAARGSERKPT